MSADNIFFQLEDGTWYRGSDVNLVTFLSSARAMYGDELFILDALDQLSHQPILAAGEEPWSRSRLLTEYNHRVKEELLGPIDRLPHGFPRSNLGLKTSLRGLSAPYTVVNELLDVVEDSVDVCRLGNDWFSKDSRENCQKSAVYKIEKKRLSTRYRGDYGERDLEERAEILWDEMCVKLEEDIKYYDSTGLITGCQNRPQGDFQFQTMAQLRNFPSSPLAKIELEDYHEARLTEASDTSSAVSALSTEVESTPRASEGESMEDDQARATQGWTDHWYYFGPTPI